ncbi:hypothetical protein [Flavobacterium sp. K5-23]|uniref:hypothetical protein n=1 Tax=Flavobacterium sp. K5-23 TaxID=2746225 RepID=UPI00200C4BBC|nr:hypothetical protein [Flavobacterium sp. K5-23]UQD56200.1 hypothetical protein FLAK523_07295 [Flavobacterium sp. K5-23]
MNGEGISNQQVLLQINQVHGTGYWSYTTRIDSKEVTTDSNGNFSTSMKNESNTFVSVFKSQDDNYTAFELSNFNTNKDIVLKVNKFLKFKIYVNNTNPFDANDYIYIDFFSGNKQSFRTKIENFGIQNKHYPAENLPGGGTTGAFEESSWRGINVNSIVYYNVPENADNYKIYWLKLKNTIESSGVTPEIQFQEDQVNEYNFNY